MAAAKHARVDEEPKGRIKRPLAIAFIALGAFIVLAAAVLGIDAVGVPSDRRTFD